MKVFKKIVKYIYRTESHWRNVIHLKLIFDTECYKCTKKQFLNVI